MTIHVFVSCLLTAAVMTLPSLFRRRVVNRLRVHHRSRRKRRCHVYNETEVTQQQAISEPSPQGAHETPLGQVVARCEGLWLLKELQVR